MTKRYERIYADGDHATIARLTKEVIASITGNACPVDADQVAGLVARVIHELGKEDAAIYQPVQNDGKMAYPINETFRQADGTGGKP